MNIIAIIPARSASSRFPDKPLALVNGIPMVQRVYQQAAKVFDNVYVATDDERILKTVHDFGGKSVLTSKNHKSGTDRCFEALSIISQEINTNFDILVNVQGDEPYIQPEQLYQLLECFQDDSVEIATLAKRIKSKDEFLNPNMPKVILDKNSNALYFSRMPIPFSRDNEITEEFIKETENRLFRHIGLYGFKISCLKKICALQESFLEHTEQLEQLRWLENGLKIRVAETNFDTYSVDTPQDLDFINSMFCKK